MAPPALGKAEAFPQVRAAEPPRTFPFSLHSTNYSVPQSLFSWPSLGALASQPFIEAPYHLVQPVDDRALRLDHLAQCANRGARCADGGRDGGIEFRG